MQRQDGNRDSFGTEGRVEEELERRIEPFLADRGYDLVEVTYRRERRGWVLRFTVDRVGGNLTVDEGVQVSREIGALIEGDPHLDRLLAGPYSLEVSSPGIFRKLKRTKDFERAWGKRIRVRWQDSSGKYHTSVGMLEGYGDGVLRLAPEEGDELEIETDRIKKVRLEPELPFGNR